MKRFKRPRRHATLSERHQRLPEQRLNLPEQRLKRMVLLFLICVAIPLYLLFDRVYSQLRQEALYQYRLRAEHAVGLVDDELTRLITREANRPFADYGFFRVEEQKLLQTQGLTLSPLSQYPVSSNVPGLIGYFQMSPEGILSSPVLPDITPAQFEAYKIQFSEAEYANRLALKNRLEQVLKTDPLSIRQTLSPRRDHRAQPVPSSPATAAERFSQAPSSSSSSPPPTIAKVAEQERDDAEVDLRSTFRGTKLAELNIDKSLYRKQQSRLSASD